MKLNPTKINHSLSLQQYVHGKVLIVHEITSMLRESSFWFVCWQ